MVIGSGSASFDLVKSLTDRLPIMLCPRWLTTPTQPIAVDDVLAYLLAALDLPPSAAAFLRLDARRSVPMAGSSASTLGKKGLGVG